MWMHGRSVISSKLLHLKRLLHRRLQSRLSPSTEDMDTLMHVLLAVHQMDSPQQGERIRVQVCVLFVLLSVYVMVPVIPAVNLVRFVKCGF